jgi:hypothetical protein
MEGNLHSAYLEMVMRSLCIALMLFAGMALSSCTRDNRPAQQSAAARQAGRDAYRAAQAARRDAKDAARQLEHAGKDFRQGWEEAKREDGTRSRK